MLPNLHITQEIKQNKIQSDPQIQRTNWWLPQGWRVGRWWKGDVGFKEERKEGRKANT